MNPKKGKNMKRRTLVVLAVLFAAIACFFTSCDAEQAAPKADEGMAYVVFGNGGSRSLNTEYGIQNYNDLFWYYKAEKKDGFGTTGAALKEPVSKNEAGQHIKGLSGRVGPFSQGLWQFTLYAYNGDNLVYEGTSAVVNLKGSETKSVPVSVSLKGEYGVVDLNNAVFAWADDVSNANADAGTRDGQIYVTVKLDGKTDSNVAILDTTVIGPISKSGASYPLNTVLTVGTENGKVPAGYYTCTFNAYLKDDVSNNAVVAGASAVASQVFGLRVYGNATTYIKGNLVESPEASVEFNVPEQKMVAFKASVAQVSANPAGDNTKATTINFGNNLNDTTHLLTMEVSDVDISSSKFTVTSSQSAVASISFDLKEISTNQNGDTVQSTVDTFTDPITITTYIAKNLSGVTVKYKGSNETFVTDYDPATGCLTFTTSHFSEYYVVSDKVVAMNVTSNKAYTSYNLSSAFSDAGIGDTIKLMSDVSSSITIPSGKEVVLDLNEKTVSANGTAVKNNGTLTIKNGTVVSTGNISIFVGNNSVTTIESGTYKGREFAVATVKSTGAVINIKGGTFIAEDNAVIAGNGSSRTGEPNTINIEGGTFNGGIITPGYVACGIYSPWKDVINVSGGKFNITGGAGIVSRAGVVTVTGGEFYCTGNATGKVGDSRVVVPCSALVFDSAANYPAKDATSKIEVSGGLFISEADCISLVGNESGRIVLKGGTFSSDPAGFVATGCEVTETGSKFTVGSSAVVTTAAELKAILTAFTDAGSGNAVVSIANDITLKEGETWTPVKIDGYNGAGVVTVNGNGHTIYGLNNTLFAGGFAGNSGIVINNLTIYGANINDSTETLGLGAFVSKIDSMPKIELNNCHLKNSTIVSTGGARVGGLIGWTAGYNNPNDGPVDTYITVKDCSVDNCSITAKGSVGAIIGHAGNNPATFHNITNCTVKNTTLHSTDDGGWRVGVVVGTANVGEVTISGITESDNILTQVDKTAPGHSNLYGRLVPGDTGKLTIDGVEITQ